MADVVVWTTLFVILSPECVFSSRMLYICPFTCLCVHCYYVYIHCIESCIHYYFLSIHLGINHDFPKVAQWFRELSRHPAFSSAVWTASDDQGYESFYNFIINSKEKKEVVN